MSSTPPRFERRLGRQVAPVNTLAGAPGEAIAAELEAFQERQNQREDRAAAEEALLAGLNAPAGTEATGSKRTIRGRAFNRGVIASQQAAQQTDIKASIDAFEIEHDHDPDGFDAKADGLLDGLLAEASPETAAFIRQRHADYSGRAKSRILAREHARNLAEAGADLQRGTEGLFDDATTAAFEGDVEMTETRRQELQELLGTAIGAELITSGDATAKFEEFERKVTSQEVIGNFDRTVREHGIEAGNASFDRWQATKPSSLGLTVDDHRAVTSQLKALLNTEISQLRGDASKADAQARADTAAATGQVNDIISVLTSGFPVSKEDTEAITEVMANLLATDDPVNRQKAEELADKLNTAAIIQGAVHEFLRTPALQRDQVVNELEAAMRGKGGTAEAVALLKALQATGARISQGLDTDPLGFLESTNQVELAPLDLSSGVALADSIEARGPASAQASAIAGEPVGNLKAAEADLFALIFEQAEVEEKAGYLGAIVAGSQDTAEATLQQLDTKGYKDLALLGGYVVAGQVELARQIMRGQTMLAATPDLKPLRADYEADVINEWAGAMSELAGAQEQRAVMLDAAFAKYAELKSRKGDLSSEYDGKLFEEALNAVMPTARFNGRRVAIPANTSEASFEDWIDSWDETTFERVAGGTGEEILQEVRSDGRLVELGNGRYGVRLPSAEDDRAKNLVLDPEIDLIETGIIPNDFVLEFSRDTSRARRSITINIDSPIF